MEDISELKGQAKRLASYMSRIFGVDMKHGEALDAVAFMRQHHDWNTLCAAQRGTPSSVASHEESLPPGYFMWEATQTMADMTQSGQESAVAAAFAEMVKAAISKRAASIVMYDETPELTAIRLDDEPWRQVQTDLARQLAAYAFVLARSKQVRFDPTARQSAVIHGVPGLPPWVQLSFDSLPILGDHLRVVLRFVGNAAFSGFDESLGRLGFTTGQIEHLRVATAVTVGIFLVVGGVGSGRSTTACTLVKALSNGTDRRVITINAPKELGFPGAIPLESGDDDRGDLVRCAMRAYDPEVVVVDDEIRDGEAAAGFLSFVLAGGQLWATMYGSSARAAPDRFWALAHQVAHERADVDSKLITGVIWQTLLPRLCDSCKTLAADTLDSKVFDRVSARFSAVPKERMYARHPAGGGNERCPHCEGKGIVGHILAAEIYTPRLSWDAQPMLQSISDHIRNGLVDPVDADMLLAGGG